MIVLLAALFVVSPAAKAEDIDVWDGTIARNFAGGTGKKDDPYIIPNAAELAFFSQSVQTDYYEGKYVSLTADIDLNDKPWTPIGNNGNSFVGVFDGNGHTVSHVNVNLSNTKEVGLFGKTGNFGAADGGSINNLTVRDSTITGTECEDVGAVAGYAHIVINCQSINSVVTGTMYVGGVCGQVSGSISRCYNTGSVTGAGTKAEQPVGGVGGLVEYRTTSDCINTGKVTAAAINTRVGGVFGGLKKLSGSYCMNAGKVLGGSAAGEVVGALTEGATITDFYYDLNVCRINNGKGTGWLTDSLSGELPTGFSKDKWTADGERIRETGDRYGVRETVYISLKNVGEPGVAGEGTPVYNFSVDDTKDWQEYTPHKQ